MAKKKTNIDGTELCNLVVKGMQDKKAENIAVIDLKNIKNAVADYFIICSGTSDTHANSIADTIEDEVFKGTAQWPWHTEGKANREWILIDYVDVVAHVFIKEKREFYGLEELWGDANIKRFDN
jgi:ribosome-associated protein